MAKIAARPAKQDLSQGTKVQGPSHENGGVPVRKKGSKKQIAEVEGDERIFSREDTAAMEEACEEIVQLSQQNKQAADQAAMKLGYMVCQMIQAQVQNQEGEQEDEMASAANEFDQYPA